MTASPPGPAPTPESAPPPPAAERRAGKPRSPEQALRPLRRAFRVVDFVSPTLAGKWALRVFRSPRQFRTPERETAWLAGAEPFAITAAGRRIAAASWGDGPAVLLAHGWEGRGSQMGAFAVGLAERGLKAVAYDALGHGASDGKLSSLGEFVDSLTAVASEVGPLRGIVAHSFGVAAACRALATGRVAAERLVFVSTPDDLQSYPSLIADLLGIGERARRVMIRDLERQSRVKWDDARRVTRSAARDLPLLLLHDRDDRETPLSGGERVAAAWPDSRLVASSGLGHRRILRDPVTVGAAVDFLAR